jgi:DMSO/TMAO reductase YedYZ heme-binding membrane subunit
MAFILRLQEVLIGISLAFLIALPFSSLLFADGLPYEYQGWLFTLSFFAVFLVMIVRPLADILTWNWLRSLVILRKGLGILSASIIASFALGKIFDPASTYLTTMFSLKFFSFANYAFFAHVGDLTGFILLLTSNTFSQRLLKRNWKRVQRLSYAYFYAGGIYEAFALGSIFALVAMIIVTVLTVSAWWIKRYRRTHSATATIAI